MTRKHRNHFLEFKAKVGLVTSKGDKTVAELTQKYNLHAKIGQLTMENDFLAKVLDR